MNTLADTCVSHVPIRRFADAMFVGLKLEDGNHTICVKGRMSQWVLFSLGSPRISAKVSQPLNQNTE